MFTVTFATLELEARFNCFWDLSSVAGSYFTCCYFAEFSEPVESFASGFAVGPVARNWFVWARYPTSIDLPV